MEEEKEKKHEVKHHEVKHKEEKKPDTFFKLGITVAVILLLVISFQLKTVNTNLDSANTKLTAMSAFFDKIDQGTPQPPAQPEEKPAPTIDTEKLMDDDAVKGDKDAPVTIIEFSDYECPFCARFYSQTYLQIKSQYIDTGKVKLVFRDFPLSFHRQAQKAAEAAECAGDQGRYYDMHDKLFEEGVKGGVPTFRSYAKDLGLDTEEFNKCLDSGKHASEVRKDMADGSAAGIRGTPGFIINGQVVSGAQPFNVFKQIIDAELAK